MTLTNAIRTATSSLASHSQQVSILSRNISGIGDPTYVRREADVLTALNGTTRVETMRYVNQSLLSSTFSTNANASGAEVVADGLDRIALLQEMDDFRFSPARLLSDLQQATEFAAAAPSDASALHSLVEQARTVATALNASYGEMLAMRTDADKNIAVSVANVNSLLSQIEEVNKEIVDGTLGGRDVFDSMDVRDQLISDLSSELGIRVISAENNGVVITTSNGAMLFEEKARQVSFQPTQSYGPSTIGAELQIDGITVTGPNASLELRTGKLAGHFTMRDTVITQQQHQLDEIARGLVDMFAEEDQIGGKPKLAGLFTWSGGPAVPVSGVLEPGIASTISVNPTIDPANGGDPTLIRDGVINGDPDYLYNTAGGPGFSDRLFALSDGFTAGMVFDAAAGLSANQSILGFTASALDRLNADRSAALDSSDYQTDLANQFRQSLQNETGPNLDYEMSRLLEVERAYQATATLLNTVDELLATLLEAAA